MCRKRCQIGRRKECFQNVIGLTYRKETSRKDNVRIDLKNVTMNWIELVSA